MRTRYLLLWVAALALLAALMVAPAGMSVRASTSGVVISAVYGGGGSGLSPDWSNDYVELFNAGSLPVNFNGWSLQYAASGQDTWNNKSELPNVTLLPGQYFLVQLAAGETGNGPALPTPDFIPNPDAPNHLASTTHKVTLFSTTGFFEGGADPTTSPNYVDFVGYGTPNAYEGSGPAPVLSSDLQAVRNDGGCQDSDDNSADFTAVNFFTPRNSATPLNWCGAGTQLLANGNFEIDVNENKVPDGWTVKNSTSDKLKCNKPEVGKFFSLAGNCAFQFKGGVDEKSKLQQDVNIENVVFNTGDTLSLSAYFKANNLAADGKFLLKVKYVSIAETQKTTAPVVPSVNYTLVSVPTQTILSTDVFNVKVMIKNKSTAGKVLVDGASLHLAPSAERSVLPVPAAPAD